jgi:hypothetical protein
VGEPHNAQQDGRLITVPGGSLHPLQQAFKTYEYTWIRPKGAALARYVLTRYPQNDEGLIRVPTVSLGKSNTDLLIWYECPCGNKDYRRISSAFKGSCCVHCRGSRHKRKTHEELAAIQAHYGINFDFSHYKDNKTPLLVTKRACGCSKAQKINAIDRSKRPFLCQHDSPETWRVFQNFIVSQFSCVPTPRDFPGYPDVFTDEYVIEVKADRDAIFRARPLRATSAPRNPLLTIRKYHAAAARLGRRFFVLVNEPQAAVIDIAEFPVLGWEKWHLVGLSKSVVARAKEIKATPLEYRAQYSLSHFQRKKIARVKEWALERGHFPSQRTCLELGASTTQMAGWLLGRYTRFTKLDLVIALGLDRKYARRIKREFTKASIVTALKRVAKDLKHAPTGEDLERYDFAPCTHTCRKFFGTYHSALSAAGLTPHRRPYGTA